MTYLRLGLAIGFLLALAGAFFYGRQVGMDHMIAVDAKAMAKAAVALDSRIQTAQQQDAASATASVERQTVVREITREVPKIVDRPVYRNVCVDADGVRLIGRAIDAANGRGAPAGGPAGDAGGVQPSAGDGRR